MDIEKIEFQNLYDEPSRNGLYKPKEFHGGGVRIVNMKELFAFPLIGNQEMQLLKVTDNELNKFGLEKGDLLFARRSLVEEGSGKCVLVIEHQTPIVFESSLIRVRLKKDKCFPLFYYYYFSSPAGRSGIKSIITGAGQKGIRGSELAKVLVILPPLAEQKAIAQSLSDVDNLITAIDKLITKKRNIKQGTMQELLTGKKRLPGFSGEWKVKRVGDICDFIVPGRNKPKKFDGDIPWITTPDLEDGRSISKSRLDLCISIDEAKNVGSKIVPTGSIIMSCAGELGITALTENEIVINQQLHAFIPSSIIDAWFLLMIIKKQKPYINSIATKTAVPYINKNNCNSIPIPLPSLSEQKAIAKILTEMDEEIEALEKKREKYKNIKQGMMQELLTGKTRIIDN